MNNKITTEYKYAKNWQPHDYRILFNDGLKESGWKITVKVGASWNVFPLEIGLDVTCGFCSFFDDENLKVKEDLNIDIKELFKTATHSEIIEFIIKDLTREIAFYGKKENYWIQNLNALSANGFYNFLLANGVTKEYILENNKLFKDFFRYGILELPIREPKIIQVGTIEVGTKIVATKTWYGEPKQQWEDVGYLSAEEIDNLDDYKPRIEWRTGDIATITEIDIGLVTLISIEFDNENKTEVSFDSEEINENFKLIEEE